MSGLYGPNPVKKINLEGNKLSFEVTLEVRGNSGKIAFAGTVEEGKLTGEQTIFYPPTTSRRTAKVKRSVETRDRIPALTRASF